MTFKLILELSIAVLALVVFVMVLHEEITYRAAEKAEKKRMLEMDMVKRKERLKKELIEHNRQQLALEYLNENGADENECSR